MSDDVQFDPQAYAEEVAQADYDRGFYLQNQTFSPPPAASSVGDWANALKVGTDFISGALKTYSNITSQRDAIKAEAQESAFNRTLKTAQLDLAKYQVGSNVALQKSQLDAAVALQNARAKAALLDQTRFFGIPIAESLAGGGGGLLLLGAAGLVLFMILQKRK